MTDYSDDERAAHWERVRRAMEPLPDRQVANMGNSGEAVLRSAGLPTRNPPEPKPLPQSPARALPVDGQRQHAGWDAWTRWAEEINARIHAFTRDYSPTETLCEAIGEVTGGLGKEIKELRSEIAKSDQAVTELLMEQERRIAALEARLATAEKRGTPALVRVA